MIQLAPMVYTSLERLDCERKSCHKIAMWDRSNTNASHPDAHRTSDLLTFLKTIINGNGFCNLH